APTRLSLDGHDMTERYHATLVSQTTSTTGTGTYSLDGANAPYRSFAAAFPTATYVTYRATDGTDMEWGTGYFDPAGPTLARTYIAGSTNSGSAVNWSAGATIDCVQIAN